MEIYGPYTRKSDGRQIIITVDKHNNHRTVSLPKWLLEQQLGRILDPDLETVDHWDCNKDNNSLENLRIVPRKEHSADDTRRVKLVDFICPQCNKEFSRSPRLVRDKSKKNKAGPFCSRNCAGKYSRMLQLKIVEKLAPQPYTPSEYFRRKHVIAQKINEVDIAFEDLLSFCSNDVVYFEIPANRLSKIKEEGLVDNKISLANLEPPPTHKVILRFSKYMVGEIPPEAIDVKIGDVWRPLTSNL